MVDTPANSSTTRTLVVDGAALDDTLEAPGDHDWFAITLVAGQTYTFQTSSIAGTNDYSTDTTLALRDPSGHLVAFNDDFDNPPGQMSKITFTATASGTYYLDVGSYNDNGTGDYRISAVTAVPTALPVFDYDQIALQLTDGYWGGDPHHWDVAPGGTLNVHLGALTAEGQFLARAALDLWSDATGIVFAEVTAPANADITFDDNQAGAFTNMSWSNGIMTDASVNISTSWLSTYGTTLNSYSLQTYIHEIGHALGLGHAGDYNGSATYPDDALYANDAWPATIMSYFDPRNDNDWFADKGFTYQFTLSPMVADLVATGNLYGERTGLTRTGDTTYGFNNTSGRDIYDPAKANGAAVTIVDDGGVDTLDYSQTANAQQIWLEPEVFSNVLGRIGNLVIARGTVIENAIGGSGKDILIGNAADNVLTGNDGNDILYGEGGDDTLSGGAGNDEIDGGAGADTIIASAGADLLSGGADGDTFVFGAALGVLGAVVITDFEAGDVLDFSTDPGDPVQLTTFAGTAAFGNTAGEYRYELSGGQTLVQYDGDGDGVADGQVLITNGEFSLVQLTAGGVPVDVLGMATNVITGTELADYLYTTATDENVFALGGNDRIFASLGTDSYDGGAGDDQVIFYEDVVLPGFDGDVSYTLTGSSFTDDLNQMAASLTSIERFFFRSDNPGLVTFDASAYVPSPATDFIIPLAITLNASNSRITGSESDDRFTLTGSNHIVDGGGGYDELTILVAQAGGTITVGTDAGDLTIEQASADADRTSIRASDVEHLQFMGTFDPSQGMTVDASASTVPITFVDYTGSDTIIGSAFDDFFYADLDGIDGTDTYTGGAGADYYGFSFAIPRLDNTIITDFAADDVLDLNSAGSVPITTFLGTAAFTGTAGEYRYYHSGGQTFVEYDGDGDGNGDGTLTLSSGEFTLEQFTSASGDHNLRIGTPPANVITGTPLVDILTGTEGVDAIYGLGQRDELYGLGGDDLLEGGEDRDYLDGGAGDDTMRGGPGDDFYRVDSTGDVIEELAGEGRDLVYAYASFTLPDNVEDMRLYGLATFGTGNDLANVISASAVAGAVEINGMGGNDNIRGSLYADTLNGGDGDDYIFGDNGNDTINGGAGRDTVVGGAGDDTIDGGPDKDILVGSGGNDTIRGGTGVDMLAGHNGDDVLEGEDGDDRLYGDGGSDHVYGGAGRDQVEGGAGVDTIYGGADQDFFRGGADGDFFIFDEPDMAGNTSGTADRIRDFSQAEGDVMDLSAIDAIAGGADDPFTFIGDAAFSGTAGELRYTHINSFTMVQMDVDGDGRVDFAIRLEGLYTLVDGDFVL